VTVHCGLLAETLDRGGGRPGVCVGCIEVTGLTIYHPHVASDGGVGVPQLDAESLNLTLSGQQTGAQLHRHILVVHHLHRGDILLHPRGLELILLPVGQEAVDGVLQPTLVATDSQGDGLPGGVSDSVVARRFESWSLVSTEDSRPEEDHGFKLHPPLTQDFLDPVPGAVVMPRCSSRA
jgi:hypothetical protein